MNNPTPFDEVARTRVAVGCSQTYFLKGKGGLRSEGGSQKKLGKGGDGS